jgi:tetratricopeptide (TPR) repeat protein
VNADDRGAAPPVDAASRFAAGEEAFRRGEYVRAAELFEEAHRAAPHHDAAWNAAQAWLRAGDRARAGTWLAVYLASAPADAGDRAEARKTLDDIARTAARIDIEAKGELEGVMVDGRIAPAKAVYVAPGEHVVEARAGDRRVAERARLAAGETKTVTLALREEPRPSVPPTDQRPREEPPPPSRGWSPFVVVAGGTVTAALAATSIGFGISAEAAHDRFVANRSQDTLDDGRAKQDLANGFFWGAVAAGVVTVAFAVLLVDWKKPAFSF